MYECMDVLQHMPAKTRMKPAMLGVPSVGIKKWLQLQTQYQHQKVHKPSARQWHDHARSLTSNQTLQKPLVPKTPSIPRLTTSGNKAVTQRTIKHDANRSKIFSVSWGHQYHYPQHGKSVLLSERSIVNRAHTKMYRPLSSTQAVHRSQRYWNRLQHKRLNTRPIKQRALIRKWFDHWQTFCLF